MMIAIKSLTDDSTTVEYLREQLLTIFGCPVKIIFEARMKLQDAAFDRQRKQTMAPELLSALGTEDMAKDQKILGITDVDLYAPGLNFVFGQADMIAGKAIISLCRLHDEFYGLPTDRDKFLERATKEAVHELGHTFGLEHCTDPKCVMHFSNSLPDTDNKEAAFCSQCRPKLIQ
jgi:archaemetzincin